MARSTSSSISFLIACAAVAACVVVMVAPGAEGAVSCGQVTTSMAPCISYLRSGGTVPANCCNGVSGLNNAAKTTPDRQAACQCLKAAYNAISGIKPALAAGLPGKCGVNIPYKISPTTDCSKVK